MAKKQKKKMSKLKKKLIIFGVELFVFLILIIVFFAMNLIGKIDFNEALSEDEAGINSDLDESTMEGYTNIALFGLDNRSNNNYQSGNSDTIIIASIDNKTKDVKLASVYRDTYLNVGDGKYSKANSAYQRGGVTQAVQMLNTNLDLDITSYVCVDWTALVETIDALDGLDIEITDAEVAQINKYLSETCESTGRTSSQVTTSGTVHLDGCQAVTYARIRKTSGDDYLRSSRQRIVIQKILEKAKQSNIATLTSICNNVFDDISTNLSLTELIGLAGNVTKYNLTSTTGFPLKLTTASLDCGSTVVPIDLANNVLELHTYLFGETDYTPSNTVQGISANIMSSTGVTADTAAIDTSKYNETAGAGGTDAAKELNKSTEEN